MANAPKKQKKKTADLVETTKGIGESAADIFNSMRSTLRFMSLIAEYIPPLAVVISGIAVLWDLGKMIIQKNPDRFNLSRTTIGFIILAAGIIALTLPAVTAVMILIAAGAGVAKKIVDFVKASSSEEMGDEKERVISDKAMLLTANSLAFAGLLLLLVFGPLFPPLAIAGFALLAASIAIPVGNILWNSWNKPNALKEDLTDTSDISDNISETIEEDSTFQVTKIIKDNPDPDEGLENSLLEDEEVQSETQIKPSHTLPTMSPQSVKSKEEEEEKEDEDSEGEGRHIQLK